LGNPSRPKAGACPWTAGGRKKKEFFFEKKNQKTFGPLG
jgi:hypothetical protein